MGYRYCVGRLLPPPFFYLAAFMGLSSVTWASGWQPYLHVESMSYSQPVSIQAAISQWHGDFYGGTRQWSFNTLEAGVEMANWSLGAFYRRDYDLRFSRDTAEAYYLTQNHQKLTAGRTYRIDLRASSFSAKGVRATWRFRPSGGWHMRVGVSLFQASDLIDGSLQGDLSALDANSYDYRAGVDYHYSRDYLFKRQVAPPTGLGSSLDFGFSGELSPWIRVHGHVTDLLGRIWWKDAPYTVATANSSHREYYDSQGNVHFNPLVSGYEGISDSYVQNLTPRFSGQLDLGRLHQINGIVALQYQYGQTLAGVGMSSRLGSYSINAVAWPQVNALSLGVSRGRYRIQVAASNLAFSKMRTLWLQLDVGQLLY